MRTTLNIEDDIYIAVKQIAQNTNTAIGAIVSELLRKSLKGSNEVRYDEDIPVFHVRENAKPITAEDIKKNEDE